VGQLDEGDGGTPADRSLRAHSQQAVSTRKDGSHLRRGGGASRRGVKPLERGVGGGGGRSLREADMVADMAADMVARGLLIAGFRQLGRA
jgi:hypothetical protein